MSIYALADLHLGFAVDKPMDIFGDQWADHSTKIAERWRETVKPDDTVLLAGDISWGFKWREAEPDLRFIHDLPGRKIMIRGNHDYWWSKASKLRRMMPPSIELLQNESTRVGDYIVAGTRGWSLPVPNKYAENPETDRKIFERERGRLRQALRGTDRNRPIIVMLHFPPFLEGEEHIGFRDILEEHGVRIVVFGHLHGPDAELAVRGERNGIRYVFCAADSVDFRPVSLVP